MSLKVCSTVVKNLATLVVASTPPRLKVAVPSLSTLTVMVSPTPPEKFTAAALPLTSCTSTAKGTDAALCEVEISVSDAAFWMAVTTAVTSAADTVVTPAKTVFKSAALDKFSGASALNLPLIMPATMLSMTALAWPSANMTALATDTASF